MITADNIQRHIDSYDTSIPAPPDKKHKDYPNYISSIKEAVKQNQFFIENNLSNRDKPIFCKLLIETLVFEQHAGEILKRLLASKAIAPADLAQAIDQIWSAADDTGKKEIDNIVKLLTPEVQCHLLLYSHFIPDQGLLGPKLIPLLGNLLWKKAPEAAELIAAKITDQTSIENLLSSHVGQTLWFGGTDFYGTEPGRTIINALLPITHGKNITVKQPFVDYLNIQALYELVTQDRAQINIYASLNQKNQEALFLYHVKNNLQKEEFKSIINNFTASKKKKLIAKVHTSDQALYEVVIKENTAIPLSSLTPKQQQAVFSYYLKHDHENPILFAQLAKLDKKINTRLVESTFINSKDKAVIKGLMTVLSSYPNALPQLLLATSQYQRIPNKRLQAMNQLVKKGLDMAHLYQALANLSRTEGVEEGVLEHAKKQATDYRINIAEAFYNLSSPEKILWLTANEKEPVRQIYTTIVYLKEVMEQLGNNTDPTHASDLKNNMQSFIKDLLVKNKQQFAHLVNTLRNAPKNHEFIAEAFATVITDSRVSLPDAKTIMNAIAETRVKITNEQGDTKLKKDVSGNAQIIADVIAKMTKEPTGPKALSRAAAILLGLDDKMKKTVVLELLRGEVDSNTQLVAGAIFANHNFSAATRAQMLIELNSPKQVTPEVLELFFAKLNSTQLAEMLKIKELRNTPELIADIIMHYLDKNPGTSFKTFVNIGNFKSSLPLNQSSYYQQLAEVFNALFRQQAIPQSFHQALHCFISLANQEPDFFEGIHKKLNPSVKNNISTTIANYSEEELSALPIENIARLLTSDNDRVTLLNTLLANDEGPILGDLALRIFNNLDNRTQQNIFAQAKDSLFDFIIKANVSIQHLYQHYPKDELAHYVKACINKKDFQSCAQILKEGVNNTKGENGLYTNIINEFVAANMDHKTALQGLVKVPYIKCYLSPENLQYLQDKNIMEKTRPIYHPSH